MQEKTRLVSDGLLAKLVTINTLFKTFAIPRKFLTVILLLMIIQAFAEAFSAMLLMPLLNSLQNAAGTVQDVNVLLQWLNALFSGVEQERRLTAMLLSIIVLMAAVQLMIILNNRLILKFSMFTVQYKISEKLFDSILYTKIRFFYAKRSGSLINSLTTDVNRTFNCISFLLRITTNLFFALGYLIAALILTPVYTLALIAVFVVFSWIFKHMSPFFHELGAMNRKSQEDANNIIVESMQGFRSLILSCAESNYKQLFGKVISRFYHTTYNSSWITTSLPNFIRFLAFTTVVIILLFNIDKLNQGDAVFFSQMMFFIYAALNIYKHMGVVKAGYLSFAFNYEGVKGILSLDSELKTFQSPPSFNEQPIYSFTDSIDFQQLYFDYIPGKTVLQNLSFVIPKNRKIAFVGKSGCGKSTLVDILAGFHDDYRGCVKIDGKDLKDINKRHWRQLLGYVSQETFIFNDTVRNNLVFGLEQNITDDEIQQACSQAQILATILAFEHGFNTILGERGVRLSGGEKQRLAIARLLLKKPQLVVLDEATSALDSESEAKVKQAIDNLSEGRTVIAVAHRLSTIADFDHIYVLEQGSIVESGNHPELIAQKGKYYSFYTLQTMSQPSIVEM